MAFLGGEAERRRQNDLAALEDKRLAFARRVQETGLVPERGLYVQSGGGFVGLAVRGEACYWLSGPAPGAAEDFAIAPLPGPTAFLEPRFIPSEGLGGALGMGKKGAEGFMMRVECADGAVYALELLAGRDAYLETKGPGPLFSIKRSRGDANFVWEMNPVRRRDVADILGRWRDLLNG